MFFVQKLFNMKRSFLFSGIRWKQTGKPELPHCVCTHMCYQLRATHHTLCAHMKCYAFSTHNFISCSSITRTVKQKSVCSFRKLSYFSFSLKNTDLHNSSKPGRLIQKLWLPSSWTSRSWSHDQGQMSSGGCLMDQWGRGSDTGSRTTFAAVQQRRDATICCKGMFYKTILCSRPCLDTHPPTHQWL